MRTKAILWFCGFLGMGLAFSCSPTGQKKPPPPPPPRDGGVVVRPDVAPPQPDRRVDPQPDRRVDPQPDRRVDPQPDKRVDPQPDRRVDPQPDRRVDPQPDRPTPVPDVTPERSTPPEPRGSDAAPPERPAPTNQEIRFVALGDTGTGSAKQKAIAQAIKTKCDAEAKPGGRGKCDFGILLGDNFYDIGVSSATDPQFKTKFSDMYHPLGFPFYITIGNHDFGIKGVGGVGAGFHRLKYYTDYAKTDPRFVLPSSYYAFKKQHVDFISLNTSELFFSYNEKAQRAFVKQTLQKATGVWKFAFGHHPYISNGTHGNAGTYEGIPFIPFVSGTAIKKFFEDEICNKVDFYLCGHDHNLQVLHAKCGVNFIVSGAGAKNKKWGDKNRNKSYWQDEKNTGFMYFHIKGRTLTLQVLNDKAQVRFTKVYTK